MLGQRGRFRRADRLRASREFRQVSVRGRRFAGPNLIVLTAPREHSVSGARARLGVTVSRKVGNAVVRNRVKRLLRAWFRVHAPLLAPIDYVLIARSSARHASFQQLSAELDQLSAGSGVPGGR